MSFEVTRDCCFKVGVAEEKPHVITPEIAAQGTRLLQESRAAFQRAVELQKSIDRLTELKDQAWAENRAKYDQAGKLLLNDGRYRG